MTTQLSPKVFKRATSIAATVALAGAALVPGLMASAVDTGTVPAGSAGFNISDASGYASDQFTLPTVANVTWTWQVGTAGTPTTASGAVTPFATATKVPANTGGIATIIVKPVAADTYTLPSGSPTSYELTFNVSPDKKVSVKAPVVVRNKITGLDKLTVPYVAGVTYATKQGTGSFVNVDATSKKPVEVALTQSDVTVKATTNAGYLLNEASVTEWAYALKIANANVTVVAPVGTNGVGTADYATVTGVDGMYWMVGTKKIAPKVGATVKVPVAKNGTSITFTPKALPGYTLSSSADVVVSGFTPLTDAAITASVASRVATITGSDKVKSWAFGKTKIVVPNNATIKVTLATAGNLVATPVKGYKLTGAGTTNATSGVLTLPVS